MIKNKHYIKIDENNNIIDGFSDAFPRSTEGFILWKETYDRHFALPGGDFYYHESGFQIYSHKYIDDEVIIKTQEELDIEINNLKNDINNKRKKIEEIVQQLLSKQNIKGKNNLFNIQEILHLSGKAKKPKKIEQTYIEDLGEWVEGLLFLDEDHDLNAISYDDIHINNKILFPDPPPGEIFETRKIEVKGVKNVRSKRKKKN
jgi:hypothetical protein